MLGCNLVALGLGLVKLIRKLVTLGQHVIDYSVLSRQFDALTQEKDNEG